VSAAQAANPNAAPAKSPPPGDGWPDISSFLDEKYGFLPVAMPITEPAVGYGAGGGLLFLSKPLGQANLGRPNITFVGGMGTANGSWGAMALDSRYWLDDHVQTLTGFIYASVNLDFHGIGEDSVLRDHPLRYNLRPIGGAFIGKYRFGESRFWAGLGYAFMSTVVSFDAPPATPHLPDFERSSQVGTLLPSLSYDTRDNVFTPLRGVYVEASGLVAGKWLGGDDNFERLGLLVIEYLPLPHRFYFGLHAEANAAFGNAPFYMNPYVSLRGVPIMRYQGQEVAALEAELRWQFWKRLSILGFAGAGDAWNDFAKLDNSQSVLSGGGGFRYELARKYGIHMGADVAFSRDTTAFYVQVGSAWMRP
jgi:outer membrane protein assembly factor BamA